MRFLKPPSWELICTLLLLYPVTFLFLYPLWMGFHKYIELNFIKIGIAGNPFQGYNDTIFGLTAGTFFIVLSLFENVLSFVLAYLISCTIAFLAHKLQKWLKQK